MGGILVEVPLRHLVIDIADVLQAFLEVGNNLLVGISHITSGISAVNSIDDLGDIGDTDICLTQLIILIGL